MDADLEEYLEVMERRLDTKLEGLENGLVEKMRDMQTELLRGFAAFSDG